MNRTLQDRLVKELRLADIDDMEAGNAFLPGFIEHYNARFAIVPARPDDLHRPMNLAPDRLKEILCKREQRYVGSQLTFSFERQQEQQTKPAVKTNSEKIGYKPRGRKPGKRTDFMTDPAIIARRRQALSQQSAVEQGQTYPARLNGVSSDCMSESSFKQAGHNAVLW